MEQKTYIANIPKELHSAAKAFASERNITLRKLLIQALVEKMTRETAKDGNNK